MKSAMQTDTNNHACQLSPTGFTQSAVSFLITKLLSLASMLIVAILTARYLGPAGRGNLAVLTALNLTFVQIANFGFFGANTFHVARDRSLASKVLSNSIVHSLVACVCCSSIALALLYLSPKMFAGISPGLMLVSSLIVGPLLFIQFAQFISLGLQRVSWMNIIEILSKSASVVYTYIALAVLGFGLYRFVFGQTAVMILTALVIGVAIFRFANANFNPCAETAKSMAGYGARSYLANLLCFLVVRADPFMINYFKGASQTGLYAVASQAIDAMLLLPTAVGTILCSRVSAGT